MNIFSCFRYAIKNGGKNEKFVTDGRDFALRPCVISHFCHLLQRRNTYTPDNHRPSTTRTMLLFNFDR